MNKEKKVTGDKMVYAIWQEDILSIFAYVGNDKVFIRYTYHSLNAPADGTSLLSDEIATEIMKLFFTWERIFIIR